MKVSRITLAKIIAKETKSMPEKKLAKEVAAYILAEGRTNELEALLRDVMALRAEDGIVEARVDSAHEVSSQLSAQLNKVIRKINPGAKHVIINHELDPDLIGGLKVSLPNGQLDTSIRAKLNRFKQLTSEGINS